MEEESGIRTTTSPSFQEIQIKKMVFYFRFFPDPIQQALAVAKTFYFFFFAAFGSLFPLMAVYFKQLGMDAAQCGFLIGVRPIIEYLATPFWNKISDRYGVYQYLLLFYILFVFSGFKRVK